MIFCPHVSIEAKRRLLETVAETLQPYAYISCLGCVCV